MKDILANMKQLKKIKEEVLNHCMCAKFEEDEAQFRVIFPPGFYPHGVQVDKAMGKAKSLEKIFEFMEKTWIDSCFWLG